MILPKTKQHLTALFAFCCFAHGNCLLAAEKVCRYPGNVIYLQYGQTEPAASETFAPCHQQIDVPTSKDLIDNIALLQQQIDVLKANIKVLANANDALTKRLNEMEAKLKADQPK